MTKLQPRRREFLTTTLGAVAGAAAERASPPPSDLKCEYLTDPRGIEVNRPRLSWVLNDRRRGAKQTAYRILVDDLWDSGKVISEETIVEYAGRELKSRDRCHWKVCVWDQDGRVSEWSKPALWTMGLMSPGDWKARWIGAPKTAAREQPKARDWIEASRIKVTYAMPPGTDGLRWSTERLEELQPAPMFRREFQVTVPVRRATVYVCGLGFYELRLNGQKIGDRVMDPVETDYDRWACYVTYDVTAQVRTGKNAMGVMLGDGWFNQTVAFTAPGSAASYGRLGLLVQLELELADGSVQRVLSDGDWKCTVDGPLRKNAIFAGELYDARKEMDGWDRPGFDGREWTPVETIDPLTPVLKSQMAPAVRVVETGRPVEVSNPGPGVWVCDMGSLFTGWARLRVRAPGGTAVTLKFAETLGRNGEAFQPESLNVGAKSVDMYICRGERQEEWEPRFTYHSFRYVQVEGLPEAPSLEARFVTSAMPAALEFECSSAALNRLHRAFVRTGQTNTIHKWTDCPSREKTGWLSYPSYLVMMHNFDAHPFLAQLVRNMEAKTRQIKKGEEVFPNVSRGIAPGRRGAWLPEQVLSTVLLPWELYLQYGDARVLRTHYSFMRDTMRCFAAISPEGILDSDVGDWHDALPELAGASRGKPRPLAPGSPASFTTLQDTHSINSRKEAAERAGKRPGGGYSVHTHPAVVSTVHFYAAARVMEATAKLLGRGEEAREYATLAERIRTGFLKRFYDSVNCKFPSQTAYALALWQDLTPATAKERVIANLLKDVEEHQGHFTTGQLGTDRLVEALTNSGHAGTAFAAMMQTDYPGFGLMLDYGATTTWETWGEAIITQTPAGAKAPVASGRPASHIQFTGVDAWVVQGLAGIQPDQSQPGFKRFKLVPHPVPQLSFARARYRSMRGLILSDWRREGRLLKWRVTIPPNTVAEAHLPTGDAASVRESGRPLSQAKSVRILRVAQGHVICEVPAGDYVFEIQHSL